jgi:lipopolysaccharide export system protein LptA
MNPRMIFNGLSLAALLLVGIVTIAPVQAETGFTNHDPDDPIRFTADRLEVKKEGRVAAFIGNVEAIQGELSLSADIVKVYYARTESAPGSEPSGGSAVNDDVGLSGFGGSVARIDTSGNVTIRSRGDLATGDWAVYDIPRKIVTMGGKVVLKRQETLLTGSRLELDLESGRSTIQSSQTQQGDTRVRGEFTPSDDAKD